MKFFVLLLSLCIVFVSCKEKEEIRTEGADSAKIDTLYVKEFPPYNWDTLCGVYSGLFSDKEINIRLTYVSEFNAVGYNVMSGLIRNVSGKVSQTEDSVKITMEEPGDHAHDGIFYLNIHKQNFGINGEWVAFNSSIPSKKFKLKRKRILNYSEIDDDSPLTEESFAYFFERGRDSLGDYSFLPDGYVTYEFYNTPYEFEENYGTMKTATGGWTFKKGIVTIFWQPNFAYPGLKSQFRVFDLRNEDYGPIKMVGEGRTIYSSYGMEF